MCGIAGVLGFPTEEGRARAAAMAAALRHRGPDDSGVWAEDGVALGHSRLSILDLTPTGAQPMRSADGRYTLVYNGEIYNHHELRAIVESAGVRLRGRSDTEALLELIALKGPEEALRLTNGMFAAAIWDRKERALTLARDRMGEKPLYYGKVGGRFAFASEIKALALLPGFDKTVDRGALALYLRHNCVPAPYSIFRGIWKLPPACFLRIGADGSLGAPRQYWKLKAAAEQGSTCTFAQDDRKAIDRADALLREAVKLRMESDVPLGAFLSGGIDSSTIVALMQAQSDRPIRTFTIGFPDLAFDESREANAVASHLKTDHTEFQVTEKEALDVIARLPEIYDEPFADSSQIPTFLVSRLARGQVTVALSGDGGDELFGGYNRYFAGAALWARLRRVPRPMRSLSAAALGSMGPARWDKVLRAVSPALPRSMRLRTPGQKLRKLTEVLSADSMDEFYRRLVTHWDPRVLMADAVEPATALTDPIRRPNGLDAVSRMMYYDMISYLPDDILAKVDRATMAVSLESRVPFLDHRVVEFSWTLPLRLKVRDGTTKWLLRQVLGRYVPPELFERPKMGFAVPLAAWLRGPLREWAEDLLGEGALRAAGYLDPAPIRKKWGQHLAGQGDWEDQLWDVLMFEAWRRRWAAPSA